MGELDHFQRIPDLDRSAFQRCPCSAPRGGPALEHAASRPRTGTWWSGIEARVVPGAPCGCLLLLRLGRTCVRPRCQDWGGPGMWRSGNEAQVVPENAEGHRCCRRGMNCCCASARTRATTLPGWGKGPGIDRAWTTTLVVEYGAS